MEVEDQGFVSGKIPDLAGFEKAIGGLPGLC